MQNSLSYFLQMYHDEFSYAHLGFLFDFHGKIHYISMDSIRFILFDFNYFSYQPFSDPLSSLHHLIYDDTS